MFDDPRKKINQLQQELLSDEYREEDPWSESEEQEYEEEEEFDFDPSPKKRKSPDFGRMFYDDEDFDEDSALLAP
ncbi:MAG: hypothetical protein J6V25_11435, partial [Oscillospiraceae bacterium]|nr:hypothetical protein [Oscillospiraceae bacterium]